MWLWQVPLGTEGDYDESWGMVHLRKEEGTDGTIHFSISVFTDERGNASTNCEGWETIERGRNYYKRKDDWQSPRGGC